MKLLSILSSLVATASIAGAVNCTVPADLCTGDPCVTGPISVTSPCVLDFGARTLVIGGTLDLPEAGVLSLTAAAIEIHGTIDGAGGNAADVTLIATNGPILQSARISVPGSVQPGDVVLQATGDIEIGGIIASATSSSAPGGTVDVHAGGVVRIGPASRVGAKGGSGATAGSVSIAGDAGGELAGHLETGGGFGGMVVLASSTGSIAMGTDIRGKAGIGTGTTFLVTAGNTIAINRHITGDGKGDGGSITISAPTVLIANQLSVKGKLGNGGSIALYGDTVTLDGSLRASGYTGGGDVTVAAGSALLDDKIDVRGKTGTGGQVVAQATTGNLTAGVSMRAQFGGTIQLEAPAGNLSLNGRFLTGGTGCIGLSAGGTISTGTAVLDTPVTASCLP